VVQVRTAHTADLDSATLSTARDMLHGITARH
jgi:hypothetical protein